MNIKNKIISLLKSIEVLLSEGAANSVHQMIPFSILVILTTIPFYFLNAKMNSGSYENLTLRIISTLLCVCLLLKNYWPRKFKKFLPEWWYITLVHSLPFFFLFMALKNDMSLPWQINMVLAVLFLALLVDWISFVLIVTVGFICAYIAYFFATGSFSLSSSQLQGLIEFGYFLLVYALFSRNNQRIEREKMMVLRSLSATLAHELRTPLSAIQSGISGMNRYFSWILEGYMLAKENNLPVHPIGRDHLKILRSVFDGVSLETKHASVIVEMFLTNIKHPETKAGGSDIFPITESIEYALSHYPFLPNQENKIDWDAAKNPAFQIKGDNILVVHILYNLIKNALYFIEKAGKGRISIWLEVQPNFNILHFKDTGPGIPQKYLSHIFERFYTQNTHQGTGVGLSFCKMVMESMGGNINCDSVEGEYAHFILKFPKLPNM